MDSWRATAAGITIVRLLRPLKARSDGKLAPSGQWETHEVTRYRPVGKVRRSRATLTAETVGLDDAFSAAHGSTYVSPWHLLGVNTELYLPASARNELAALVPRPTVHLGEIANLTRFNRPLSQNLRLLRLSPTAAVVVTAERKGKPPYDAKPWEVTRLTYQLEAVKEAPDTSAQGSTTQAQQNRAAIGQRQ